MNGFWTTAMQYMLWFQQQNHSQQQQQNYSSYLYHVFMRCLLETIMYYHNIIL